MRAWSAEELVVRAYAAAASAVQAVLDGAKMLERITRPLQHDFDEPLAEECLRDGGERQTICGTQYFRSKAGHQCTCILASDHPSEGDCHLCGCGERWRDIWDCRTNEELDDLLRRDGLLLEAEPALTDDELVGVRGLLQERYGDQSERADTQDAEMWRAAVGVYAKMDPRNCGYCGQPNRGVHKSDCKRPETAAPVCDATIQGCVCVAPEHINGWHTCEHGAKFIESSPAASTAGDSPSEVSGHPPVPPSEGRPDPVSAPHLHDGRCESEFIEGPMAYSLCGCSDRLAQASLSDQVPKLEHPPVPPVGHSEQRIHDVLIEHSRVAVSGIGAHGARTTWGCRCDRAKALGPGGYINHVLDLLNVEAPGPPEKPAFETGHDMGVSFASELFPQHRNNK